MTFSTGVLINGNPTVYFNNASLNTNSSFNITTAAASVFAVTQIAFGGQFLFGPQGTTNNVIEWATTPTQDRWKLYNGTVFYSGANLRSVNIPAITSSVRQAG